MLKTGIYFMPGVLFSESLRQVGFTFFLLSLLRTKDGPGFSTTKPTKFSFKKESVQAEVVGSRRGNKQGILWNSHLSIHPCIHVSISLWLYLYYFTYAQTNTCMLCLHTRAPNRYYRCSSFMRPVLSSSRPGFHLNNRKNFCV